MKKYVYSLKDQIILNPTENLPYLLTSLDYKNTHGLYVSDKIKDSNAQFSSKIAFSGRDCINQRIHQIYKEWQEKLDAKYFSMRFLSGLHMHILIFMSLANFGDTVALLPETAGGHYATKKILERLGLRVIELIPDNENLKLDIEASLQIINNNKVDFLFIDRSEGLSYENFYTLCKNVNCYKIFDASQYLAHIICKDYMSPLDMGFDLVVSTIHKNFPGPQKAIAYTNKDSDEWQKVINGVSSYVSSLHVESTLMAGNILENFSSLPQYSQTMIKNADAIREVLVPRHLNVVRPTSTPHTQHIWLKLRDKESAFTFYQELEKCGILVNYRLLPYNLGYGIRMGTAAATLSGLTPVSCEELALLISQVFYNGANTDIIKATKKFVRKNIHY